MSKGNANRVSYGPLLTRGYCFSVCWKVRMRRCYPKISQGLPDPAWQSQADLPERANLNNPTAPQEQRPQLLIWLSSWSGTQHRHSKMQSLAALHLCLAQKPHPVDAFVSPSRKLRIGSVMCPRMKLVLFYFHNVKCALWLASCTEFRPRWIPALEPQATKTCQRQTHQDALKRDWTHTSWGSDWICHSITEAPSRNGWWKPLHDAAPEFGAWTNMVWALVSYRILLPSTTISLCWELWHTRKVYIPRECHCMCLNPLPTNAVLYINRSCPQLLMSANTDFGTSVLPKNWSQKPTDSGPFRRAYIGYT